MPNVLTRLRVDEVSCVDRGAGEGVKIVLMKRKNKQASKSLTGENQREAPIMSFFQKLFARKAPADIHKSVAALAESVKSIMDDDEADKSKLLAESFDQFEKHIESVAAAPAVDTGKSGNEDPMDPNILKALGLAESADNGAVLKAIADLTEKAKKPPFPKKDEDDDDEAVDKAAKAKAKAEADQEKVAKQIAELPEAIRKQLEEHAAMKKTVEKLQADADLANIKKIAADALLPDSAIEPLSKLYKSSGDPKAVDALVGMLKAANSALHASDLLKELGGQGSSVPRTALDELNAKAAEARKADPKLTREQAFTKIYTDPENVELVKRERKENAPPAG